MIRPTELLLFIETIQSTLSQVLRPELSSSNARKSADQLIEVLNRMAAQVRDGDRLAAPQLERWRELRRELDGFYGSEVGAAGSAADTGTLRAGEELQAELDSMQAQFLDAGHFSRMAAALADPRSAESRWYRAVVAAGSSLWESNEDSVDVPVPQAASAASAGIDLDDLRERLSAYLTRRFPGLPADAVSPLRVSAGGMTKLTALFSLAPNPVLPRELVLRRDVAGNMTGTVVGDEYPTIDRLFKLGLLVPEPIVLETDPSILGGAFMIMTAVDAEPAGTYFAKDRLRLPRNITPQFGRDAAAQLARLHRLTRVEAPDARANAAARVAEVDKAYEHWRSIGKPPNSVIMDLGFAWLKSHPLETARPRCLIHGDYGVHNMMARDGRLAGILDWELASEEDPAIDLAECRMMMVEDTIPWPEFVAEYLAAGGDPRACSATAMNYFCVWSYTVKFGLMLCDARNVFIDGLRRDSLTAMAATQSTDRIMQMLARAMQLTI